MVAVVGGNEMVVAGEERLEKHLIWIVAGPTKLADLRDGLRMMTKQVD